MPKSNKLLAEKYLLLNEDPLEVEITSSGEHNSECDLRELYTRLFEVSTTSDNLINLIASRFAQDTEGVLIKQKYVNQTDNILKDIQLLQKNVRNDLLYPERKLIPPKEEDENTD